MIQRSFKATIQPSIYWWNTQSVFEGSFFADGFHATI